MYACILTSQLCFNRFYCRKYEIFVKICCCDDSCWCCNSSCYHSPGCLVGKTEEKRTRR